VRRSVSSNDAIARPSTTDALQQQTDAFYSKIMDAAKISAREALEQGFAATTSKLLASGEVA